MRDFARSIGSGTGTGDNFGVTFETRVSLYDRVLGGLIALLALGLFSFTVLFSIWYFQTPAVQHSSPRPVKPKTELLFVTDQEEQNVVEFDVSQSQAFTEVIEMAGTSVAERSQSKRSSLIGTGDGGGSDGAGQEVGIRRSKPSPAASTPEWNVIQEASSLEDYQSKLDFFAIEIGAVHKSSDKIWRISQLSTKKVTTESSRSAESTNRYFVNQQTRLLHWDQQTIAQSGFDLQDVIAVHFYPSELIVKMQQLIDARYKDRANDLTKVTFKIVGTPGNLRFKIEDVQFEN